MLHLQKLLLPVLRHISPVHHSLRIALLSTEAVAVSLIHFAAQDYLVTTCGLTKQEAANAAKHIAHCKSPSNANAVLSFLASPTLGLSLADIAHLVSLHARILNCSVEKTLRPRIDAFFNHGFTAAQIRIFIRRAPLVFRCFNVEEKLGFWVPFFGSPEKLLRIIKRNFYLVSTDLDRVVKVNIQLLRENGLTDDEIAKVCVTNPRLLTSKTDGIRAILMRAEKIGVPRHAPMFRQVVASVASVGPETMAAKLKFIGEMLGCSDDEVAQAVKQTPALLRCSREKLQRASEFLTQVVGVDNKFILGRPTILTYSIERRLAPRHYVVKVLLENGLMHKEKSFYSVITVTDKTFKSRYLIPHKDVLPGLADAYALACKGKLPT